SHNDYDLVGTQYVNADIHLQPYEIGAQLFDDNEIKYAIQSVNSICQGSIMIRASFIRENNIEYYHQYAPYEDYELSTRIVSMTKVANLPDVLYFYRRNPTGIFL